jgi:hypothetical protein
MVYVYHIYMPYIHGMAICRIRNAAGYPRYGIASELASRQRNARCYLEVLEYGNTTKVRTRVPQTRTTIETVHREAMQALVRVQAHMLARIVVEIRAADIAAELEPQLLYTVMSYMLTTPTSVPVAPS